MGGLAGAAPRDHLTLARRAITTVLLVTLIAPLGGPARASAATTLSDTVSPAVAASTSVLVGAFGGYSGDVLVAGATLPPGTAVMRTEPHNGWGGASANGAWDGNDGSFYGAYWAASPTETGYIGVAFRSSDAAVAGWSLRSLRIKEAGQNGTTLLSTNVICGDAGTGTYPTWNSGGGSYSSGPGAYMGQPGTTVLHSFGALSSPQDVRVGLSGTLGTACGAQAGRWTYLELLTQVTAGYAYYVNTWEVDADIPASAGTEIDPGTDVLSTSALLPAAAALSRIELRNGWGGGTTNGAWDGSDGTFYAAYWDTGVRGGTATGFIGVAFRSVDGAVPGWSLASVRVKEAGQNGIDLLSTTVICGDAGAGISPTWNDAGGNYAGGPAAYAARPGTRILQVLGARSSPQDVRVGLSGTFAAGCDAQPGRWTYVELLTEVPQGYAYFVNTWELGVDLSAGSVTDEDGSSLGSAPTVGSSIDEPVNTDTGNLSLSNVDLAIPGRGPPLRLTRSYNTRDPRAGIFGQGWSSDLGWSVGQRGSDAVLFRPDGRRDVYRGNADGTFSPPSGVFDVLSARASGGFTLITADQHTLVFGADGLLGSYADRNETALSYVFTADAQHVAQISAPGGRVLSFEYDADGHLTRASDSAGRAVLYGYASGRLVAVTDATGAVTRYAYDASGRLTTITDPLGNVVLSNVYDSDGRVTSQTDAVGGVVRFAYDATSRITTHTDARGNVTRIAHDAQGRTIAVTDPVGKSVQYAYDARGNKTSFADRNGNTWRFAYDDRGNRTLVTDPAGGTAAFTYDAQNDLLSRTDPNGNTWRYAYDGHGNLTRVTDPEGAVTATDVDASGLPTKVTDADGVITSYAYDASGDLTDVTTAAGTTHSAFDAAGRLVSRTDANHSTSTFAYDAADRLVRTADALGQATTLAYDRAGHLVSVTDRRGATTAFAYDAAGRMTGSTDALGGTTAYAYDANGDRTAVTDPAGKTTRSEYDARDRLVAVTDPLGATARIRYDDNGNVVGTTDPRGGTASFAYDFRNLRTSATDRAGGRTSLAYDAAGRAVSTTDPLGAATGFAYDRVGRLITTTDALGGKATVAYSAAGRRIALTDPTGNITRLAYDTSGRLVRTTDALGGTATLAYDPAGDIVARADTLGRTTTFTYDALERLVAAVDALGARTTRAYDAEGALTALTDPGGASTAYTYDALGRLTRVADALGGITRYAYDARRLLTSLTDANGHTRTYAYDAAGRLVRETDGLGRARTYSYDVNGDRTSMVDAKGQTTSYRYDAEDRLTGIGYADGTAVTYTRDAAGQRTAMTDPLGTTSYQYDALRRPTSVTDAFGKTVGYGYDAKGLRTSLTYPDGRKAAYTYDALDRLSSAAFAGGSNVYSYDAVGNAVSAAFANGTRFAATYDPLDRITALTNYDGEGKTAAAFSYGYDARGNVTSESATGAHDLRDQRTYTFDALSRLLAVTDKEKKTTRYGYDAVGNRTAVSRNKGDDPLAASFDAADQLTAITRGGSPFASFQYDANGELTVQTTDDRTTAFSWDAAGRLTTRTTAKSRTSYAYTGDGDLVRETRSSEDADEAPKDLQYTLDTAGPLSEVLTASSGKDAATFLYGLGRIAALGKDTRYYGADIRGSVRTLTDERGKVKSTASYDAWGVPKDDGEGSAQLASLFGFTGERQDAKAGLEYLRARWYSPQLGVFLSPDPAQGRLGDPRTLPPYGYAMDDPTSKVDRSGRSAANLVDGFPDYAYSGGLLYGDPRTSPSSTPLPGPAPSPVPSLPGESGVSAPDLSFFQPFIDPGVDLLAKAAASSTVPQWELTGFSRVSTSVAASVVSGGRLIAGAAAQFSTTELTWSVRNTTQVALKAFLESKPGSGVLGGVSQAAGDFLFHAELSPTQRAGRIVLAGAVGVAAIAAAPAIAAGIGVGTGAVAVAGVGIALSYSTGLVLDKVVFPRLGLGG